MPNDIDPAHLTPTGSASSPFLPNTNIQFAWDSTSIGYFKTCPRLYQYIMIDGWSSRAESIHLRFGIEFHAALELHDRLIAEGHDRPTALRETFRSIITRAWDWSPDAHDERTARAAKYKNRDTLLQLVHDYITNFHDDPAATYIKADGTPAVELSFRFDLDFGPGGREVYEQPYLLCGHLDRVVTFNDSLFVMDRKAQPLTTKVLTPDGYIKIGDLHQGDLIAGSDGEFYPVLGLYPKGITEVYEIVFNDGCFVRCAKEHIWHVRRSHQLHWVDLTVKDLLQEPYYIKHEVPRVQPINHPQRDLPLDPYVLGLLLADGYFGGNSVQFSTAEPTYANAIAARLKSDVIRKVNADNYSYTISGGETLAALRQLNLWKCLSRDKFIPSEYLFASIEDRRSLLQGLLDGDGSFHGYLKQYCRYQTLSPQLSEDVRQLVLSFGGSAVQFLRSDGVYRLSIRMPGWEIGVGPRYIKSITKVEDSETLCIETAAPDHLYVTEDYIITHNTTTTTPGAYYFAQYEPHNQMSLYTLAGRVILNAPIRGVIIDAAQIKLDDPNTFARGFTHRTEAQLDEWLADLRTMLNIAEAYAVNNYWPMNDTSCDKFGGCAFRDICRKDPRVRPAFLKTNFDKLPEVDRWNPLRAR